MAKSSVYMPFFHDWIEAFEELPGDQCKELLLAMVRFHKDGTEPPPFSGSAKIAATFLFTALERSKRNAAAGKKGGQTTASKNASSGASTTAPSEQRANVNHKDNNNDNNNDNDNDENKSFSRFAEFWAVYPRKIGKMAAQKAWDKLAPDDALCDTILSAMEAQKRSAQWCKDGGQYIPNPSTWINQRRWEDELSPAQDHAQSKGSFETDEFYKAALEHSLRLYDNIDAEEGGLK